MLPIGMAGFTFDLVPVRFRRDCPQLTAAVHFWCMWQLWAVATPRYRRTHAADLLTHRRDLQAAFAAKGILAPEIAHYARIIRRHAVADQRTRQAEEAAREATSRAAFESGRYDRTNVALLCSRQA